MPGSCLCRSFCELLLSSAQRFGLFSIQQKRIDAHYDIFADLYRGVGRVLASDLGKISIPVIELKLDAYVPFSSCTTLVLVTLCVLAIVLVSPSLSLND